jgi:hypothetical protein
MHRRRIGSSASHASDSTVLSDVFTRRRRHRRQGSGQLDGRLLGRLHPSINVAGVADLTSSN